MRRLAIYFYFDKDGIVDRYVDYYLNDLCKNVERLFVVVNGNLTKQGEETFKKYAQDVLVRDNRGLDVWATKDAIDSIGWDTLRTYDEVILSNFTATGPVYPFAEMFEEMGKKEDLDFWGITAFNPGKDPSKYANTIFHNPYGYLPRHIQSPFIVYRNRFLKSDELKSYWDNMPEIKGYVDSVSLYESYFTKHFEDLGYKWDVYVDETKESEYGPYLLFDDPVKAIKEKKCPVYKRKTFSYDYSTYLVDTMGELGPEALKCIKETGYDTDMIYENMIRTTNLEDLVFDMGLNRHIDSSALDNKKDLSSVLIVASVNSLNELEYLKTNLLSGVSADCLVLNREDSNLYSYDNNELNRVTETELENTLGNYKYLFVADFGKYMSAGLSNVFKETVKYYKTNLLKDNNHISKVIDLYENDKFLGLLMALPAFNSTNFANIGLFNEEANNKLVNQIKELKLSVPYIKDKMLGTSGIYWTKADVLKDVLKNNNKDIQFLFEADERLMPLILQNEGYYTCTVTTDLYKDSYTYGLYKHMETINSAFQKKSGNNSYDVNTLVQNIADDNFITDNSNLINKYVRISNNIPLTVSKAIKIKVNSVLPFMFKDVTPEEKQLFKQFGIKLATKTALIRFIASK